MNYDNLRHSCAHLLAAAVLDLYPKALPTIGPAIDNGFYYDFDNLKISGEDLPRIETKMHELVKSWSEFKKIEVNDQKAMQQFSHNSYKLELIADLTKNHEPITIYQSGSFTDLCRGGHCEHPSKELKHFRLLSIAGAYWRGNEKNKMLSRIYGTAFSTRKELDEYLTMLEESKKRDHKKLGPALELFMFHETAPGMPYWLPKGVIIYNELVNFWRREHKSRGYQEIVSPILNKKELYITSGHYDHYWSEMFVAKTDDEGEYGVKAMNCPNAHVVFGSKTRSYRDLPLRLSDTDSLHRYERSGVLNGLFRVREFRQDDAHIYVSKDQIKSEYKEVFDIVERFYSVFNLKYSFRLGTRNPENFMGNVATWDKAEATLKKILEDSGKEYSILDGDGAFYGPKVDILMKDSLGREWQMGTVQLDFQQPRRFKLQYTAADGTQKTPVTIHRVFPLWLAPVQAVILPISDKHADYAQKVLDSLKLANIRCELVLRNEPLPARVRDAEMQKIPYILVVGNREAEAGLISIRHRGDKENVTKPIAEFISGVTADIIAKV
ncbi:MAG: Threonine-tRNA ligase [Candidatus Amesbacteria bacterium GW2011_GWB1_47_26]|nr:MAG: Threonine-tRNA ligase [Candidatus Amesbacteria bacterium GW2011_GWB1_47_26]